jgi:ubiquinone/menaquinone biosynthesis C-methylase UbiE
MSMDTKQAEREYLARAGTERWERVKPFSTPGHDDVEEAARLMHDFAVALACLRPRPGERVLDLGAGSCWCSEWLQRLNIDTVSVDIAFDMLRIGRDRLPHTRRLAAGDLESLPFLDASFDKAVCLNAFHHVPDGRKALAEVRRVLRPGGLVLFSEPGRGHADAESSVVATGECGVLEQEVIVAPFLESCAAAGFVDVRLKPVAYAVPWYEADLARWTRWERAASTTRPVRALAKLWRAVLEGVGAAKETTGFESALGIELIRILKGAIDNHPIVVARRPG